MNTISRIIHRSVVCACVLIASVQAASAQYKAGEAVDKIVAVVGNEIILQSDVMSNVMMAAQQDRRLNPTDPKVLSRALDMLINDRLVIIKAQEDSVTATEEEISERLEFQLQGLRSQVGSDKRIEALYGMSIAQIKREFRDDIRKRLLSEKISQQKFAGIKVSAKEVQDFFKQFKDSIPKVPPQYELYHIVKYVDASNAAKEKMLALAQKVRDSLVAGGKFAEFAKRYSDDPGSKGAGGDLGLVNRGNFIAEFEKMAYSLQPNEISQPVETPFGYHIIQLIEKQENAVNTRHILFKIGQTEDDGNRAKKFLDSLKQRTEKSESFEDFAKMYSDDTDTKAFGGSLGRIETARMSEALITTDVQAKIEKLPDGGVVEPTTYAPPSGTKSGYRIIWRKKFFGEHQIALENDYKRVEQLATAQKRAKLYEDWMKELRRTIYWEVKK